MATTRRLVEVVSLIFILLCVINFQIRTASAAGCWYETKDVHGRGGIGHRVDNLTDCQILCLNNSTCVAFDWQPGHSQTNCWILTSSGTGPTSNPGVITNYRKRSCGTRPPTPPMSTTVGSTTPSGGAVNGSIYGELRSSDVSQVHAIRPAYIVLAGLGAGNILLVVIAVVIICSYPLNRSQLHKNGVSDGGAGVVGGGGVAEDYEMSSKEDDYPGHGYSDLQQPQPQHQDYSEDNDINDRRYTTSSYEDEPPMSVEENPYFNKGEIEASAAF